MNILVTGANGQLGREMRLVSQNSEDRYIFTDVVEADDVPTTLLDMTDSEAVNRLVDAENVHFIVNCAAYTNVDKAETDIDLCRRLNAEAPRILAEAMKRVGGLLVHISTDYVFGGDPYNTPCREDQKGTPTGVYGLTKLEGEQAIQQTGCQYVILRTAWLYSEFGRNFVKTMLNLTATRPQLKVVFDQVGTPTYALDLAKAIVAILQQAKDEGIKKASGASAASIISATRVSVRGTTSRRRFSKSLVNCLPPHLLPLAATFSLATATSSPVLSAVLPFPSSTKQR